MADEKRIALLIDAENISAQYADYIIGEVDNYGICSYKRIYGSASLRPSGKARFVRIP